MGISNGWLKTFISLFFPKYLTLSLPSLYLLLLCHFSSSHWKVLSEKCCGVKLSGLGVKYAEFQCHLQHFPSLVRESWETNSLNCTRHQLFPRNKNKVCCDVTTCKRRMNINHFIKWNIQYEYVCSLVLLNYSLVWSVNFLGVIIYNMWKKYLAHEKHV